MNFRKTKVNQSNFKKVADLQICRNTLVNMADHEHACFDEECDIQDSLVTGAGWGWFVMKLFRKNNCRWNVSWGASSWRLIAEKLGQNGKLLQIKQIIDIATYIKNSPNKKYLATGSGTAERNFVWGGYSPFLKSLLCAKLKSTIYGKIIGGAIAPLVPLLRGPWGSELFAARGAKKSSICFAYVYFVYLYIYICIFCIFVYLYICIFVYLYICIFVYLYICIFCIFALHMYICLCIFAFGATSSKKFRTCS